MQVGNCSQLSPTHRCLQPYEEPDDEDEAEDIEDEEEDDKATQYGAELGDEEILRSQSYESGYNTGMAAQTACCGWLTDRRVAVNSLESRRQPLCQFPGSLYGAMHARPFLLER